MISEAFFIYLLFNIFTLVINLLAFTRIPILGIFGVAFTLIIVGPSIDAFGEYAMFAIMLGVMNLTLPVVAIVRAKHGE